MLIKLIWISSEIETEFVNFKNKRKVKENIQNCFDGKLLENVSAREKPIKKLQKARLYIEYRQRVILAFKLGCFRISYM